MFLTVLFYFWKFCLVFFQSGCVIFLVASCPWQNLSVLTFLS